jgi:hypothetical protein
MVFPILRHFALLEVSQLFGSRKRVPERKPNLEQPMFAFPLSPTGPPRRLIWVLKPGWKKVSIRLHVRITTELDAFQVRQTYWFESQAFLAKISSFFAAS